MEQELGFDVAGTKEFALQASDCHENALMIFLIRRFFIRGFLAITF
jgi:hypothetical protein